MDAPAEPSPPLVRTFAFQRGLLSSLEGLALRCALITVAVPLAVFAGALVLGHRFFADAPAAEPPQAVLALALGSYVLIPMLALTGAFCALVVSVAIACSPAPGGLRIARGGFLIAVAALALLVAFTYDAYLLPDLLK